MTQPDPSLSPPRSAAVESPLDDLGQILKRQCGHCHGAGTQTLDYDDYGMSDPKDEPCWYCAKLDTWLNRAKAEHARAILRYTAKGYSAGENADVKHWRQRAEAAEQALASSSPSRERCEVDDRRRACARCRALFEPESALPLSVEPKQEGWQPISTAPKDGRYLQLIEVTQPTGSDLHIDPNAKALARTTVGRYAYFDGTAEWVRYGIGRINSDCLTHWAPMLPPPPAEEEPTP